MALIEDSQVVMGGSCWVEVYVLQEVVNQHHLQCRVTVRRHYTQRASISKALEIRLAS